MQIRTIVNATEEFVYFILFVKDLLVMLEYYHASPLVESDEIIQKGVGHLQSQFYWKQSP